MVISEASTFGDLKEVGCNTVDAGCLAHIFIKRTLFIKRMVYWGSYPSRVKRMRKICRQGISSPLPRFLWPVTSQVIVPPGLRKYQNTRETRMTNDSSFLAKTDSESIMDVALLSFQG